MLSLLKFFPHFNSLYHIFFLSTATISKNTNKLTMQNLRQRNETWPLAKSVSLVFSFCTLKKKKLLTCKVCIFTLQQFTILSLLCILIFISCFHGFFSPLKPCKVFLISLSFVYVPECQVWRKMNSDFKWFILVILVAVWISPLSRQYFTVTENSVTPVLMNKMCSIRSVCECILHHGTWQSSIKVEQLCQAVSDPFCKQEMNYWSNAPPIEICSQRLT